MKVGVSMKRDYLNVMFYIRCVVRTITLEKVIYDVVTNCGVTRFVPMDGDKLPKMVVDFMAENADNLVTYVQTQDKQFSVFFDMKPV